MLSARIKLWLERDGSAFFGDGRAALLEAINETGSLSQAAKSMKMSYRTAWENINQMETALGRQLVLRQTGGSRGGGCTLTDHAHALLAAYAEFRESLETAKDQLFRAMLIKVNEQADTPTDTPQPEKKT